MSRIATVTELNHIYEVHRNKIEALLGATEPHILMLPCAVDGSMSYHLKVMSTSSYTAPSPLIFNHHGEDMEIPVKVYYNYEKTEPL